MKCYLVSFSAYVEAGSPEEAAHAFANEYLFLGGQKRELDVVLPAEKTEDDSHYKVAVV